MILLPCRYRISPGDVIERRSEIPTSSEDFLNSFVRPRRPVLFSLGEQQKEKTKKKKKKKKKKEKRPPSSDQRDRGDTATDDTGSDTRDVAEEDTQTSATPTPTLPSGLDPPNGAAPGAAPGAATLDRTFGWHTARWSDEYLETVAGDLEVAVETVRRSDVLL